MKRYKRIKVYDVVRLLEVSPVGIPAYPDAVNRSLIKSFHAQDRLENNDKLNCLETEQMEIKKQEEVKPEEKPEAEQPQEAPQEEEKAEETAEEKPEEPKEEKPAEAETEEKESSLSEAKEMVMKFISEAFKKELEKLKAERGLEAERKKLAEKSIGELAIESGFFKI